MDMRMFKPTRHIRGSVMLQQETAGLMRTTVWCAVVLFARLHMVIILVFKFVSRCLSECAGAELKSAEAVS